MGFSLIWGEVFSFGAKTKMRTIDWQRQGWLVTMQPVAELDPAQRYVVMLHRQNRECYATPVCGGKWRDYDELSQDPWIALHQQAWYVGGRLEAKLRQIEQVCYCRYHGFAEHCDYCTGLRTV
jgi:hypothetical protein